MNTSGTKNDDLCPACQVGQTINFFTVRRPVDVGHLFPCKDDARKAAVGTIELRYCTSCEFVHNRSFEPDRINFSPGYEVSLVHSPTFQAFTESVAARLVERYDLHGKTIVEIGCGKGEFLTMICELGGNTGYGFDKSLDVEADRSAGEGHVRLIRDYYDERHSDLVPDLICSLSVFEDIQEPFEFLEVIRKIIGDRDTKVYFEVFNGGRALQALSGWSIHYEQCNYWSRAALVAIFERCGFKVLDAGTCYGDGEYLYVEAEGSDGPTEAQRSVAHQLPDELASFSAHHEETIAHWGATLSELHESKRRVAVWGTGGKGIGFLNEIPSDFVDSVIDINPNRQQKFVPGSGHRIEAPEYLVRHEPDVIIITNPLYRSEIEAQVEALGINCEFMVA